jgi:HD-GYP domain-containing protein (c-di-GMP phosphodiesterase class II)
MYSLRMAELMGLPADEIDTLRFGGYLHDIGKIGVRDTVLLKPGGLTEGEMQEIRLHSVIGDEIVKPIRFFDRERKVIRHHHERYDGKGYPDGLAGNDIPLIARILAVADTYDAMTSHRPYRKALARGGGRELVAARAASSIRRWSGLRETLQGGGDLHVIGRR